MCAVLDMLRYTTAASAKATAAAVGRSKALRQRATAFEWLRAYTWLNPRPAGGPCRCCLPRQVRDCAATPPAEHRDVPRGARALTDVAVRWAFVTAGTTAAGAPQVTLKLRGQLDVAAAQLADAEAEAVEAVALHAAVPAVDDPAIPAMLAERPLILAPAHTARRAALDSAIRQVERRRTAVASVRDALRWWPAFVAASLTFARTRAARRARAAVAVAKATSGAVALTAQLRAERERAAWRRRADEAAARAALLLRRAAARTAARDAARARAAPTEAARLVACEATRRGARTLAIGGDACADDGVAGATGADGLAIVGVAGTVGEKRGRAEESARDARATSYARHIHWSGEV